MQSPFDFNKVSTKIYLILKKENKYVFTFPICAPALAIPANRLLSVGGAHCPLNKKKI
jgi:hypothetical protein